MKSLPVGLIAAAAAWTGAGQTAAPANEILVFGAASLTESLQELGKQFEASTGTKVVFSFGASSDLARQIEAGAPADVFFSADTAKMDAVEKTGRVRAGDRREFLSNTLVVVVPSRSTTRIASANDLLSLPKLALADPVAVPAGIYAKEWLTREGVWDSVGKNIIPTLDVRGALAAVASGDVPAGIVYRTDAVSRGDVRIAYTVTDGPVITYSIAPLAASRASEAAAKFVSFLDSSAGRAAFERRGFLIRGAK